MNVFKKMFRYQGKTMFLNWMALGMLCIVVMKMINEGTSTFSWIIWSVAVLANIAIITLNIKVTKENEDQNEINKILQNNKVV